MDCEMKKTILKILILCVAVTGISFYFLYISKKHQHEHKNALESSTNSGIQNHSVLNVLKGNQPKYIPKFNDDMSKNPRAIICPNNTNPGNYRMLPINPAENRSKVILMWNRSDWGFKNTREHCEYKNCYFIDNKCDITRSDAVIFHSPTLKLQHVPKRIPGQIFVYFSFEPPSFTRGLLKDKKWQNVFNWTFHYRRDSDNMQPYVKFIKQSQKDITEQEGKLEDLFRSKNKTIAWFVSHCKTESKREKYVDVLQKYINVDIYGKCGPLRCYSRADRWKCLDMLDEYKFYLGFENSICRDYVTEKQLYTAYEKNNIIPVTRGATNSYLYKPPGTYIDTADFETITDLSKFLKDVASSSNKYKSYFKIRSHYKVVEHWHHSMCELCKRLNNVDRYKRLYNDLYKWENEIDGRPICDKNPKDFM